MPQVDRRMTLEHEKFLWEIKELDLNTSKGLLRAVMFYLIKCFGVWHGKELRQLQTSHVCFDEDEYGKFVALKLQSSDLRKGYVKRYDDPANPRSVYKIMKKFQGRIANEGPLLVRPISSIKDFICYGPLPLGFKVIDTFIQTLMEDSGIGRCFVNNSLNLHSIDTLMRFGIGQHCLSSWLMKNNKIPFPSAPECSSSNCEELNPEVSVMFSRLLDAPCPLDAVDIIQKMEKEELQSKTRTSTLPNFDSWMTNLSKDKAAEKDKECPSESEPSAPLALDLTRTSREFPSSHGSSKKNTSVGNISSKNVTEKFPSKKEEPSKEDADASKDNCFGIKIMSISSISEDVFSLQSERGENVGETKGADSNSISEKLLLTDNSQEKKSDEKGHDLLHLRHRNDDERTGVENSKLKAILCRKRKSVSSVSVISQNDEELAEKKCKVEIKDDCRGRNSSLYNLLTNKSSVTKGISNVHNEVNICEQTNKDDMEEDKMNRRSGEVVSKDNDSMNKMKLCVHPSNNVASSSRQIAEGAGEGSHKETSKSNASGKKINFPVPDIAQDSITILRSLLCQTTDKKSKSNDKNQQGTMCNDSQKHMVNGKRSGTNVSNVFNCQNVDIENPSSHEVDVIVMNGRKTDEEDCCDLTVLSPPTLSPQPPTNLQLIEVEMDTINVKSVPSLMGLQSSSPSNQNASCSNSPNIVQFLDKAQQQIKNILSATAVKVNGNDVKVKGNDVKAKSSSMGVKCGNGSQSEIDISFKRANSRKHLKPVKITNTIHSDDDDGFSSESKSSGEMAAATSPKPSSKSKDCEQVQSHVSLLRQFLEQPEMRVPSSQSTLNAHPSRQYTMNLPFSSSKSPRHVTQTEFETSEPPMLTFMGTKTASLDTADGETLSTASTSESEDSTCIISGPHQSISNDLDLKTQKEKLSDPVSHLNNQEKDIRVMASHSQPSSSSALSTPPPGSNAFVHSPSPNSATYHIEKDFLNNAVYQSLKVNYEKDDMRTFTFADIPNLPDSSTSNLNSRKSRGNMQMSEINLGDYFPPGTVIAAKDIHLATQQGSDGCDVVMKFKFVS